MGDLSKVHPLHGGTRTVEDDCFELMERLIARLGVEAYARWLARQSPALDELPGVEIRAKLMARAEEVSP